LNEVKGMTINMIKNTKDFKKILLFFSALILLLFFCSSFVSCSKTLSAEEIKIRDIVDPLTENYFVSINNEDYGKFSKDFDDGMKNAVPKENFNQLILPVKDGLGDYVPNSIRLVTIASEKGFTAAYYDADFSKKSNVKIKMVFSKINGEFKISDQWFQ
jgi:hypothetical protein